MNRYPTTRLTATLLFVLLTAAICRAQNISGVVNSYYKVTAINVPSSTLTLTSTAGLTLGMSIVIMQMKGATIDITNTATFGNITAINNAGNYEVNTICSIAGNNVVLKYALLKTYTVAGLVQLITLPKYTDAVVTGLVTPLSWDPTTGTGGVVAIQCTNTLTLNASIDASDAGFRGGLYIDFPIPPNDCNFATNVADYAIPNPTVNAFINGGRKGEGIALGNASYELGRGHLANGGGGANNHNSGGAGGSNYGVGGQGGERSMEGAFNCHGTAPGLGGLTLQPNGYSAGANKIFMGGGGGSGHGNNNVGMNGGNGGGIVIVIADQLIGNNNLIAANGSRPFRAGLADPYSAGGDGGGGAGAGGVVILSVNSYSTNVQVQATGGRGSDASTSPSSGCFGPGGGGGGGVIWVKGTPVNPLLTTAVSGGTNGLISVTTSVVACRGLANNAAPGGNGAVLLNYPLPSASTLLCIPLAIRELLSFTAKEHNHRIDLNWKLSDIRDIKSFSIERSIDQNNFASVGGIEATANLNYSFVDQDPPEGNLYYRIRILYADGQTGYSTAVAVIRLSALNFNILNISPNPTHDVALIKIQVNKQTKLSVEFFNSTGQKVLSMTSILQKGLVEMPLNLHRLSTGTYFIHVTDSETSIVRTVVKSK
jgi:hypothetical protein